MSQDPGDELADRVTALEQQQRADRRALGSLDADLADLQEQRRHDVRLFRSIRETQIEHGRRLDGIDGRLEGIDGRLDRLEAGLAEVKSELTEVQTGLTEVRTGLAELQGGLTEVRAGVGVIVELLRRDAG